MKIAFLSNFYNHHQSYLSKELYKLTEGQYRFIETEAVPGERKKLGYSEKKDEFVMSYYDSKEEAQQWIDDATVVIMGSAPGNLLENRKKKNKLIFRYAERPLKNGFEFWKYPIRWLRWHRSNPKNKPIYMLCASGFTASDYAKFGVFKNKCYKWGYFPECKKYESIEKLIENKKTNEILWCGRFLDWKHPDDVLTIAEWLKRDGYDFHVSMIGTGELEANLKRRVSDSHLQQQVSFLGSMSPEKVRQYMERAGIFLFTSDRKEGWGAVLNESMNSGCIVIASDQIGSVPYLLRDNDNGMIYKSGDTKSLYEKVRIALSSSEHQLRLGRNAYKTIVKDWNYEIAATRFIELAKLLLSEQDVVNCFDSGPCSKA